MLNRVKSPVLALVLLSVLPVSSVRSMMLDRVGNPVLAFELSRRYKSKAYVVSERIIYALSYLYLCCSALVFAGTLFPSSGFLEVSQFDEVLEAVALFCAGGGLLGCL
ncbi:MAG: hypothetical protein OXI96_03895, partial [Acidimicrobiaceae bacterium]|nr:hypothetical protein [Acidimicrobiaceae bacterium]